MPMSLVGVATVLEGAWVYLTLISPLIVEGSNTPFLHFPLLAALQVKNNIKRVF